MAVSPLNTPRFRGSYINVFKARKNDLNGKDEYSVVALFPKGADLSALKKAANDAIVEKLGADKTKWPKGLRSPFRDQAEREKDGKLPDGHEAGAIFINLKSTEKPGIVDANVQDILEERQVYSGAWFIANIRPYYYDQKGNKGVSFGLLNLQKVADGDPLGGKVRPTDAFKPVEGAAAAESAEDVFA